MHMKTLRPRSALRALLNSEAAGGLVLMGAAALALVIANSPLSESYFQTLQSYVLGLSVLHWINDALMAVFFLLVGLEIKREFLDGRLSTWSRRILPGIAALGGMVAPAAIYLAFNSNPDGHPRGWAIPAATDIAFALGVLALLGPRIPVSLKVFLTALAILDDLGAVLIIAMFYTSELNLYALSGSVFVWGLLMGLNRAGYTDLKPYLLLGVVLWSMVLLSGVHATVAGVALALTIPLRVSPGRPEDSSSPLHLLEHALHPWVAFLIIPVFGFANAGVSFAGMSVASLLHPVSLGVASGLFIGKQIGVFVCAWLVIRMNWADLPANATLAQLYGVSLLCGIGFTMSLFIGLLAFPASAGLQDATKVGVLLGSILSGLLGAAVLLVSKPERRRG